MPSDRGLNCMSAEFGKNRLKQLHRKVKRNPNSYQANLELGLFHFKRGDIAVAVGYLERASNFKKDQGDVLFIIANAYRALSDLTKSEEYFKRALSLEPDNFDFLYHYGLLLNDSNRRSKAVDLFVRAAKIRPDNHELLNDIGVLHYQQRRFDKAIDFLQKALEIEPQYVVAGVNLGYAYLALNDIENAQKTLDQE